MNSRSIRMASFNISSKSISAMPEGGAALRVAVKLPDAQQQDGGLGFCFYGRIIIDTPAGQIGFPRREKEGEEDSVFTSNIDLTVNAGCLIVVENRTREGYESEEAAAEMKTTSVFDIQRGTVSVQMIES